MVMNAILMNKAKRKKHRTMGIIEAALLTACVTFPVGVSLVTYSFQTIREVVEQRETLESTMVLKDLTFCEPNALRYNPAWCHGTFVNEEGQSVVLTDHAAVLEGKYRLATILPKLEEGKRYNIRYDTANTMLEAKLLEENL